MYPQERMEQYQREMLEAKRRELQQAPASTGIALFTPHVPGIEALAPMQLPPTNMPPPAFPGAPVFSMPTAMPSTHNMINPETARLATMATLAATQEQALFPPCEMPL